MKSATRCPIGFVNDGIFLFLLTIPAYAKERITSAAQLNAQGKKVGICQGRAAELVVREKLPEAEIVCFNRWAH